MMSSGEQVTGLSGPAAVVELDRVVAGQVAFRRALTARLRAKELVWEALWDVVGDVDRPRPVRRAALLELAAREQDRLTRTAREQTLWDHLNGKEPTDG